MIPTHNIIFHQQKEDKDCGIACLAMSCDIAYDCARELLSMHPDGGITPSSLITGIIAAHHQTIVYVPARLESGRLYIVAVPSLNIVGAHHYIVVDWRDKERCLLYDPNANKPGCKAYGYDCELVSYAEVIEIVIDDD